MSNNGVVNEYYALPADAQEEVALAQLEAEMEPEPEEVLVSQVLAETLSYMENNGASSGLSPREVARGLNIKPATAIYRVNELVKKGLAYRVSLGMYAPGVTPDGEAKPEIKPRRKSRPKPKADYDEINVSRVYRHRGTGLTVAVDENGKAKMPKVNLSVQEMRAVMLLSQRIAEMNKVLGLG